MVAALYLTDTSDEARQAREAEYRANALVCPLCYASVDATNWLKHFEIHHPGTSALPMPERRTAKPLTIDPEFQALIAPLTTDERGELEKSLLSEGCRDALVTWKSILVDGHNRYAICQKHNLPYLTIEREFETRDDVIVWMVHNQLARRNIVPMYRIELALTMKDALARKAKLHQATSTGGDNPQLLPILVKAEPINTQAEVAKLADASKGNVAKVENILENAPEPIKQAVRSGEISINRADKLTKALKPATPEVHEIVTKHCIDDPDTVDELIRWQTEVKDTFEEVYRSGYVQPGDEPDAVHITHGYKAIKEALKKKSDYHAYEGAVTNGTPKALQMSESNEWYTPAMYINAARELMGGIDTDPASNPTANAIVGATTFYTIETNGLDKDWKGRVWLNPPYGRDSGDSNQETWSARLIAQYEAGITTEAVLLVNAVTDRKWFQPLWEFPICFTDHRIKFYDESGEAGQPTHGNALIYLGENWQKFAELFKQFGPVVTSVVRKVA